MQNPLLIPAFFFFSLFLGFQAGAVTLEEVTTEMRQVRADQYPVIASEFGVKRPVDFAPASLSEETAIQRRLQHVLEQAQKIDRNALSENDKITLDVLMDDVLWGYHSLKFFEFKGQLLAIDHQTGYHFEFLWLLHAIPKNTLADLERYLALCERFGAFTDKIIETLREGARRKIVPARVVVDKFAAGLKYALAQSPEQSPVYEPFQSFPPSIGAPDQARLKERVLSLLREVYFPSLKKFRDFLNSEYLPAARQEIAVTALPNGKAFYNFLIRTHTTKNLKYEEVHELGLREVTRIRSEMEKVIKQAGFKGTFGGFIEYLHNDPRFYAQTPEQLLSEASFILKKMDSKLPLLFNLLPRAPYGVKQMPDYMAPTAPTAYYDRINAPDEQGLPTGFFLVNTYNLKARPLYELESLALHEAVPGHHLEVSLARELNMPVYRRSYANTAYGEGWALYSERLGREVGFYTTPYTMFGHLSYEMWRACRLVVDTGVHAMGWTRQRAIDFMNENTALSEHNIESEVDRYIAWPGQALAYKIGELHIRQLRLEAEQSLGEKFNIRTFHQKLLENGPLPLEVHRKVVRRSLGLE